MQVLIVKTSSMGDILHTLPALTDATRAIPNIRFDWVVEENFSQIPTWHPGTRRVILVAIRRWCRNWLSIVSRQERYHFKCSLLRKHYDIIIDAQGLLKSAMLVTRNAQGEKHGFNYNSAREPIASFFYNQRHKVSKEQHAIERIRQLFATSLGYRQPTDQGDYAIVKNFIPKTSNTPTPPYLVFLHSTTRDNKHWPESHWHTLITLASKAGYHIRLPWGKKHEYLRSQRLAKGFNQVEVLPNLTLTEMGEQLRAATAVVSVDTGLSHLASILNQFNLTLYGPTNPKLIGCYGKNHHFLYSPDESMNSLQAEYVWQVCKQMLLGKKKI